MRKYYPGITLFKLIGSLAVVLDHIKLPSGYSEMNKQITGLHSLMVVVPCFYIISGFLAYQGWLHSDNSKQYIRKYLMWILTVYMFFFGFYIIEHIIPQLVHYGFIPHLLRDQAIDILQKLFDTGPTLALWFIPPLVFGVVSSYYFESRNKIKLGIVVVAVAFILTVLLHGTLRVIIESYIGKLTALESRVSLTFIDLAIKYLANGLTFVFVGVLIGKYINQFLMIRAAYFIAFAVAFTALEIAYLNYALDGAYPYLLVFSMLPLAVLAFRGILRIKLAGVRTHHKYINVFTIVLYFCHVTLMNITFYVLDINVKTITTGQTFLCLALIVMECLTLTTATFYVQKNFNLPIKRLLSRA
jgi:hypothetical protein